MTFDEMIRYHCVIRYWEEEQDKDIRRYLLHWELRYWHDLCKPDIVLYLCTFLHEVTKEWLINW
jgi:hypothetical protein